jgi:hypothetical protein
LATLFEKNECNSAFLSICCVIPDKIFTNRPPPPPPPFPFLAADRGGVRRYARRRRLPAGQQHYLTAHIFQSALSFQIPSCGPHTSTDSQAGDGQQQQLDNQQEPTAAVASAAVFAATLDDIMLFLT